MSRKSYTIAALLCALLASQAIGSPPTLTLPTTVNGVAGAFVTVPAATAGKTVVWFAIDPGLNVFPAQLLKDTRTAVVTSGKAGTYRLLAITGSGDELSTPVICTVSISSPPAERPPPPAGPQETPKNEGVFLYEQPQPQFCGPNGCSSPVPSNFNTRRFRR